MMFEVVLKHLFSLYTLFTIDKISFVTSHLSFGYILLKKKLKEHFENNIILNILLNIYTGMEWVMC